VRQCLVALSESSQVLRELFNYRYIKGGLKGHNFGNIFLSTLEKITGGFDRAVENAGQILRIKGKVIPVTLKNTKLIAVLKSGKKIIGQHNIDEADISNLKKLKLEPRAEANPKAIFAIKNADKIVINPGNLFCSITPNFLVKGIADAVRKSTAKKIYICNLMTKLGHTHNLSVVGHLNELEKQIGENAIDYLIFNKEKPEENLLKKYSKKGEYLVDYKDLNSSSTKTKFIGGNLLSDKIFKQAKNDAIKRALVRHDSGKIAKIIYEL
ncbi:YvcK family protein, partial [Candidatus Parcubacteria bacterium]|nr:YvcK family protein [Candidatus Parcubacteria bacterium]